MLASAARPGTEHDGFWIPPSRQDVDQCPSHRTSSDEWKSTLVHLQREKLPLPGRALPARVLWRAVEHDPQFVEKCAIHLGHAVVGALVVQAAQSTLEKTSRSSRHGGDGATEQPRCLIPRTPGCQGGQNQIPECSAGISGSASRSNQLLALGDAQVRY